MFWLWLPRFTFLFPPWSLPLSSLSEGQEQCQCRGRWGMPLLGAGREAFLTPSSVYLSLPWPSSRHGDVASSRLDTAPHPFWTQFTLLLLPLPLATSPAEPGGVPGAVHGRQVPCQQARSKDQGAGNAPGVREDPSEASGGGFSFQAKQSCPSGWSHACSEGLCKPGTLLRVLCQAARPADRAGAPLPPAWPALWVPQSLPILHSVSVLAFRQGTGAA